MKTCPFKYSLYSARAIAPAYITMQTAICNAQASCRTACLRPLNTVRRLQTIVRATTEDESSSDDVFSNKMRKHFRPQKRDTSKGFGSQAGDAGLPTLGNKLVLGNDLSETTWRQMDKKVNKYPGYRTFTAIGSGGDEFKDSMVKAVEAVVGQIHVECVQQRASSKGAYVSVRIGPVMVKTPEQVIEIFANLKKDDRLKWYM